MYLPFIELLLYLEIAFVITLIVLQVFIPGFPKELLLLYAGAEFGLFIGFLVNWTAMILAAQIAYESTRFFGRLSAKYDNWSGNPKLNQLGEVLKAKGNRGLFGLRLAPYSPNDLLSLFSGMIRLPRKGYILVSIATAVPYALIFSYLGQEGNRHINFELIWIINLSLMLAWVTILYVQYMISKSKQ